MLPGDRASVVAPRLLRRLEERRIAAAAGRLTVCRRRRGQVRTLIVREPARHVPSAGLVRRVDRERRRRSRDVHRRRRRQAHRVPAKLTTMMKIQSRRRLLLLLRLLGAR